LQLRVGARVTYIRSPEQSHSSIGILLALPRSTLKSNSKILRRRLRGKLVQRMPATTRRFASLVRLRGRLLRSSQSRAKWNQVAAHAWNDDGSPRAHYSRSSLSSYMHVNATVSLTCFWSFFSDDSMLQVHTPRVLTCIQQFHRMHFQRCACPLDYPAPRAN
jgi:hypothetical protein